MEWLFHLSRFSQKSVAEHRLVTCLHKAQRHLLRGQGPVLAPTALEKVHPTSLNWTAALAHLCNSNILGSPRSVLLLTRYNLQARFFLLTVIFFCIFTVPACQTQTPGRKGTRMQNWPPLSHAEGQTETHLLFSNVPFLLQPGLTGKAGPRLPGSPAPSRSYI